MRRRGESRPTSSGFSSIEIRWWLCILAGAGLPITLRITPESLSMASSTEGIWPLAAS